MTADRRYSRLAEFSQPIALPGEVVDVEELQPLPPEHPLQVELRKALGEIAAAERQAWLEADDTIIGAA